MLWPALLYFAVVFGTGFILGPIRVTWVVPAVGTRAAELMEMPIMLVAIILAARWISRRYGDPAHAGRSLGVGIITLGLVLGAELLVGVLLRHLSLSEVLTQRDPISGSAYYGLILTCALLPYAFTRGRSAPRPVT